jgi:hypothetical protein
VKDEGLLVRNPAFEKGDQGGFFLSLKGKQHAQKDLCRRAPFRLFAATLTRFRPRKN